jgi:hypothetical protein
MKTSIIKNALVLALTTTVAVGITCYVPKDYTCLSGLDVCVPNHQANTSTHLLAEPTYGTYCGDKVYDGMGYYDCHNSSITCYQSVRGRRYTGLHCFGTYLGSADTMNTTSGLYANLGEPGCY